MASHNTNYKVVSLATGINTGSTIGNSTIGHVIHQVMCVTSGSVTISALGGGKFTIAMTPTQTVNVLCAEINVVSGSFVGFITKPNNSGIGSNVYS